MQPFAFLELPSEVLNLPLELADPALDDLRAQFWRASGQQAGAVVCIRIGPELSKLPLVRQQLSA
jgi:hypothetical protein